MNTVACQETHMKIFVFRFFDVINLTNINILKACWFPKTALNTERLLVILIADLGIRKIHRN